MKDYNDLEELLLHSAFADLSQSDKDWVLQYISADEYFDQRSTLLAAKADIIQTPLPPKQLEKQLMEAFQSHHSVPQKTSTKWVKPLVYSAILAGVFLLGRWSISLTEADIITTEPIVNTVTDTIYIDRVEIIEQLITKEIIVKDTVFIQQEQTFPVAINSAELMPLMAIDSFPNNSSTVKDDAEIYEILVDVY